MSVELPKKILVVQARSNPTSLAAERKRLRSLSSDTGITLAFVNPLTDDSPRWNNPRALLKKVDATLWPGSLDLNIPQDRPELQLHMRSVLPLAQEILERDLPTVGICFGHQTLVTVAGGRVEQIPERREKGTIDVKFNPEGREEPLFKDMPDPMHMIFSHMDSAAEIPQGAVILGKTEQDPHSMLRIGNNIITMQGHPELTAADIPPVALTHELVPSHPTDLIVVNFFKGVASGALQTSQRAA